MVDRSGAETNAVLADGSDYAVIQIVAKNPAGAAWSGQVDLTTDLGSFSGAVPEAEVSVTTDSNGESAVQFACVQPTTGDPSPAGRANVMVRNVHATVRLTIICQAFEPGYDIQVEGPSGTTFHADGFTHVALTARVLGRNGDPEDDASVVFETADGSAALCPPSLTPCDSAMLSALITVSSDAAGNATAYLRAPTEPGVVQVQAGWTYDVAEGPVTDLATVPFALDQSSIELEASRNSIPASGSSSADLVATVIAPDGDPVADGSNIVFRVTGGSYTLGSPAADTQTVQISGGAGQAMATLNGSTTLGVASITAAYTSPGGRTIRTAPVSVEFVQPGQLLLLLDADPQDIYTDDQETSTVSLTVERDGAPVGGQQIRFYLSEQDAALATFGAQGTTPSIRDAQRITNPSGEASIEVRGLFAGAAGSVVLHASTEDAQNGNEVVESSLFVLLKRHPLLQSVVFVGAEPSTLGTQGSSRPSTAVVTFRAFDDNSEPMEGIDFRFLRPITIDPLVSITTIGGGDTTSSDSSGTVIAYLSAGVQAHPVRVIAEATDPRTGLVITVTSDAIPITSGLASFTHSWLVCAHEQSVLEPPDSRSCQAVLADRFSERVPEGHSVQLRVESGNITPSATTGGDGAAGGISYITGYPPPMDVLDLASAFDTANPRDTLVSMLAYTRGEEPFTDVNGNGSYDPGEPFVDFPEPFVDKNDDCVRNDATDATDENYVANGDPYLTLIRTDPFVDGNNDGLWNGGNNAWDDDTLIWFQEWTLHVFQPAFFQWVDVECADGLGAPARCASADGIRRIAKGEPITIRFRVIDGYGNCPAPGTTATYSYSAENADGSADGAEVGCGLSGQYYVDPVTGYVKPYCVVFRDLELAPDLTVAEPGVGSQPRVASFSTASSEIGQPIKITITFNGDGSTDYPLNYLIPCTSDADCGADGSDPNEPGPTCSPAGECLTP